MNSTDPLRKCTHVARENLARFLIGNLARCVYQIACVANVGLWLLHSWHVQVHECLAQRVIGGHTAV